MRERRQRVVAGLKLQLIYRNNVRIYIANVGRLHLRFFYDTLTNPRLWVAQVRPNFKDRFQTVTEATTLNSAVATTLEKINQKED